MFVVEYYVIPGICDMHGPGDAAANVSEYSGGVLTDLFALTDLQVLTDLVHVAD